MSLPKYLEDIDKIAYGMPFGDLDVRITRHRSKTSKVTFSKEAKIEPKSNEIGYSDIEKLLNNMVLSGFDGKLAFDITFKKGTIQLIAIKNKETKTYGQSSSSQ